MENFSLHADVRRHLAPARAEVDVPTLRAWCREVEDHVVSADLQDARVLAGFQHLSRVQGVLDRYRRVLDVAGEVTLFGIGDHSWHADLPGVREVSLPDIDLAHEWFVVVDTPSEPSLLVARPVDGGRYDVVRSRDAWVVEAAAAALDARWVGSISLRPTNTRV